MEYPGHGSGRHAEKQMIIVTVPQQPALAGIDPYDLLDWEDYDIKEVEIED